MIKGNLVAKSGRYYAVYRINKKQHWKSLGLPVNGRNKKKAEQAMLELLSKVEQEQILHSTETLVGYLENWLKESKGLFKPSTWESYGKTINGKILPYFKTRNMLLNELTPGVFTEYFQYLKELGRSDGRGGLSKKTVTNIKNVLSSALEDARRNKIIDVNPIFESRLPSFENEIKKERAFYTADQLKKLLDYAKSSGSHMYIYLLLSSHSGLRRGELLALKWSCIDFKNNAVHIIQNRTGSRNEVTKLLITPKSKSSVRTLILPESVMEELRKEKLRHEELDKILGSSVGQDYVVRTVDGKPYSSLNGPNRVLDRLAKACGLPHTTTHGIRHSVASMLDESGCEIRNISVQLGHQSVVTTERIYVHRNRTSNAENAVILEKLIG